MADNAFEHPRLAAIYDALDTDRSDLDVYAGIAKELGARRVLDVGCGTGTFAVLLADRGFDVTGVDPAPFKTWLMPHWRRLPRQLSVAALAAAYEEHRGDGWPAVVERWDFGEVNELIEKHNRWFPIEARLPMDPRTRDFVKVGGRPYRAANLAAELIDQVARRVEAAEGGPARQVAVAVPATWGPYRTGLLRDALARVGLDATLVPVAADGYGAADALRRLIAPPDAVETYRPAPEEAPAVAEEPAYPPPRPPVVITALSSPPPPKDSDPAITFTAIDDRGQQQQSITFLGTFSRCDDPMPPKQFVSGKTYESCLAYLIPGGGSIQKIQWDNGPAAANEVTPYFERPIVWG